MSTGGTAGSSSWCPKIYFNYRCFTGPYVSKGRLMLLPQSVGPGPVSLVIREVLSMLINVAYKSSRILRELQLDGAPNPSMQQQILGAKYAVCSPLIMIATLCDKADSYIFALWLLSFFYLFSFLA